MIKTLPEERAQDIATEAATILKIAKPPMSNLKSKTGKLIKVEIIVDLAADKRNETVVILTTDKNQGRAKPKH